MPVDLKSVGKKLGSVTHTYEERDVMLYALGVGCGTDDLRFTYERDLKVLPTFAVIPSFPAMLNLGGAMDVNPAMVLHGEQAIELLAEIPTSGTLTTTPTIKAIYDKVKGAVVVVSTESVDQKGRVLFRSTSSIFARGEGGFGGERGPSGARNVPPDRKPDKSIAMKTLPQQALIYRLSGALNPLHAAPDFAKLGGFDRPILHGLCTYGYAGRAVLKAYCNDDPARMKSFEVRFSGVVYPGETITTDMWQIEPGKIVLTAKTERGEAVLSGGTPCLPNPQA
jgi:acyl dehydratase